MALEIKGMVKVKINIPLGASARKSSSKQVKKQVKPITWVSLNTIDNINNIVPDKEKISNIAGHVWGIKPEHTDTVDKVVQKISIKPNAIKDLIKFLSETPVILKEVSSESKSIEDGHQRAYLASKLGLKSIPRENIQKLKAPEVSSKKVENIHVPNTPDSNSNLVLDLTPNTLLEHGKWKHTGQIPWYNPTEVIAEIIRLSIRNNLPITDKSLVDYIKVNRSEYTELGIISELKTSKLDPVEISKSLKL